MHRGIKPFYLFFWFIQVLAIGLSLYAHPCGFLTTPDSIEYLAAAKSFRYDWSLLGSQGEPFVYWPPLFPIILAAFKDPMEGLVWINILCQLFIGLAIYRLSISLLNDTLFRGVFVIVSLLSVQVIMVSVFVWSDLIFVVLTLWNFCAVISLTHPSKSKWALFLITGFLMCLQRNAGIFWVVPTCLWLFFHLPYLWKKRVAIVLVSLTIMTSGFWIWNAGNPTQLSIWTDRMGTDVVTQITRNVYLIGINLGRLYVPIGGWIACLFFLALMIAVAYLLRTQWLTQLPLQLIVVVLLGFIGGYTLYDMLDPHDLDRYLAVLVPILYLLTSMALERGHKNWPARVQVATLGLLFLWALYPITRTVHNVILWHNMSCTP